MLLIEVSRLVKRRQVARLLDLFHGDYGLHSLFLLLNARTGRICVILHLSIIRFPKDVVFPCGGRLWDVIHAGLPGIQVGYGELDWRHFLLPHDKLLHGSVTPMVLDELWDLPIVQVGESTHSIRILSNHANIATLPVHITTRRQIVLHELISHLKLVPHHCCHKWSQTFDLVFNLCLRRSDIFGHTPADKFVDEVDMVASNGNV